MGLRRVQATQASSSHIVIDLVAILGVPARSSCNSDDYFLSFFAGDIEIALGTCPRAWVDIGPTTMRKAARRRRSMLRQVSPYRQQCLVFLLLRQLMFLQDRRQQEMGIISAGHHRMTQYLEAWRRLLEPPLMCRCRVSGLHRVCRNPMSLPQRC